MAQRVVDDVDQRLAEPEHRHGDRPLPVAAVAEREDRALAAREHPMSEVEVRAHSRTHLVSAHRHQLERFECDVALIPVAALRDALELAGRGVRERAAQVVARHAAPQAQHPVHEPERGIGDAVERGQREERESVEQRRRREVGEHLEGVAPPGPLVPLYLRRPDAVPPESADRKKASSSSWVSLPLPS